MSNSADDLLFVWVQDTLNISLINNITNAVVARDDWADSDKGSYPRIEYNPLRFNVSEGGDAWAGQFGITVLCDRSSAYGDGDSPEDEGDLWTLETSVLAAIANEIPTATGFKFSPATYSARRRPTKTPDDVVGRRLNFNVTAYPGASVPLSGGEASLTGLSSNLKVTSWNISTEASTNKDFTRGNSDLPEYRTERPTAVIQIRARIIGDGSTLFPAVGSRQTLTPQVTNGKSWNNEVLIRRVQWVPNADEGSAPQLAIITGIIGYGSSGVNSGTPVFDGTIP